MSSEPEALSKRYHFAIILISLAVFASRLWGLARSPWDWDEMLFSLALRDYDVALHHPHPPGFPFFIGAAHLFRAAGLSDFRALQALNVIVAPFIVPAIFFLCRELRFRLSTSLIAAVIFAFLPNVWFFGETAFSDVPAVVIAVAACAFLLRGGTSGGALMAGALLLGISAGMRPQNLLVGAVPFTIATWQQLRAGRLRVVAAAAVILTVIVVFSYAVAARATGGWERYIEAIRLHQQYIDRTDSFRSAIRPSLIRVGDDFFVRQFRAPIINYPLVVLIAISVIDALRRRRREVLIVIATFAPFTIAAWLVLDFHSVSRFSIGYMPMYAILGADGISVAASAARRYARAVESVLAVALVGTMIVWTAPAIAFASRETSPPVQAVEWIRANVDRSSLLYVDPRLRPWADYFLADYRYDWENSAAASWRLVEGRAPGAHHFAWERGHLWDIARRRYFEVSVLEVR